MGGSAEIQALMRDKVKRDAANAPPPPTPDVVRNPANMRTPGSRQSVAPQKNTALGRAQQLEDQNNPRRTRKTILGR